MPFKLSEERRAYQRNWAAKNREKSDGCYKRYKEKHGVRLLEMKRAKCFEHKLRAFSLFGSKCQHCGFKDHRALQIDHVLGGGTKERLSGKNGQKICRLLSLGRITTEGLQLLCANCNWIKRFENGEHVKHPAARTYGI